ncbi:thermonuclease family protein [Paenisporosarcina macmurdoensis]|uniref:Thermonuclease family protein n=1 Tax=Paenisporosarcina macmurdoensis TaxID=212659 RepID=A0ABW1L4M5_9BACL
MKKWLWLLSMIVFLTFGCVEDLNQPTSTGGSEGLTEVELVHVIDGDTIKVKYNGKTETIRYLLVDTPEVRHQTLGNQPFGDEASIRNQQLLEDASVSLEFDVGERYDDYGRLLAYVYADGQSVQQVLLQEGLARVAYVFPPNTRHLDSFEEDEANARQADLNIWQYEKYVTNRGFDKTQVNEVTTPESKENDKCFIKGNINRENKKIYHIPSGKYYEQTNPEKWFCTEQQAVDAGFKKSGE